MDIYQQIEDLVARHGGNAYVGEPVSQKEHALQSAHLAERAGASDSLVVAALLHDIGHLLVEDEDAGEAAAASGVDTRHEVLGQAWLSTYFPSAVTEPVYLHVAAKRYLCAKSDAYLNQLSPASVRSLQLQGGPMTTAEIAAFEANPYFKDAVQLRHYDDTAKIPGLAVPDVAHYEDRIRRVQTP
jgi:phosphonate degradation associated HDIG domain protein